MSDQPIAEVPQVESIAPELADLVGESQPTEPEAKQVNSPVVEDKNDSAETTKENASKENDEETTTTDEKTDGEDDNAQPKEFEVGGRKYDSLEKAIEAINRINGDNTRLTGDVKSLRKEKMELQENLEKFESLLQDYQAANEEWQRYYDGDGERPDNTKADIELLIDKKVKEIKASEKNIAIKEQFDAEFDEIFQDEGFAEVESVFNALIDEYEGTKNPPSPKKLFERAKILSLENKTKDITSIDKEIEERVKRELAKREASKGSGASGGGGTPTIQHETPPELVGYFD